MATPSNKTNIPARPKCLNILLESFEFFTVSPRNIPNRGNVSQGKTGNAILFAIKLHSIGWSPQISSNAWSIIGISNFIPQRIGEIILITNADNKTRYLLMLSA